ncbi:hypothetical protein HMPREF3139_08140 [Neisseria sp. HMSC15G01]|nr:hypothetical protein HMPREF3139_08140 [Neisseria sp. HMSC15G01]
MPKRYLEAAVAAAEVSISITYGEQQNRQTTQVQVNQAQASQIQAGGKTTLIAGGAGEQSNINITGSDVSGKAGTGLIADNDITLQSAEQSSSERSNNKSSGWIEIQMRQTQFACFIQTKRNQLPAYAQTAKLRQNEHITQPIFVFGKTRHIKPL